MKRCLIIFLVICTLITTACSSQTPTTMPMDDPSADFAPLEFTSFDDFSKSINETKTRNKTDFTTGFALQIEEYDFSTLAYYYIPSWLPEKTSLEYIRVKDVYVALYYTIDIPLKDAESARDTGINELISSIVFTWYRYEDGKTLLENTIKQQELKELKGFEGVYHSDIYWPDEPDTILSKQIFWEQDGYMFMMSIPVSVFEEKTQIMAEKAYIK